jgi:hypothetical protein
MKLARLNINYSVLKNRRKCEKFEIGHPTNFGDPYLVIQEVSIQNFNGFGLRPRSPSKSNKNWKIDFSMCNGPPQQKVGPYRNSLLKCRLDTCEKPPIFFTFQRIRISVANKLFWIVSRVSKNVADGVIMNSDTLQNAIVG